MLPLCKWRTGWTDYRRCNHPQDLQWGQCTVSTRSGLLRQRDRNKGRPSASRGEDAAALTTSNIALLLLRVLEFNSRVRIQALCFIVWAKITQKLRQLSRQFISKKNYIGNKTFIVLPIKYIDCSSIQIKFIITAYHLKDFCHICTVSE